MTARTSHHFWADQPPGPCEPGPLTHLFRDLRLLVNGAAPVVDCSSGQIATVGVPANYTVTRDIPGVGISLGTSTASYINWTNRPTAATKVTFFGVIKPDAAGTNQLLIMSSGSASGGQMIKVDTGNRLTLSKPGVVDYASLSLTDGEPVAFIGSHDEVSDVYWLMKRSLRTGLIASISGTNTNTASAGDGTYTVGGRTDGSNSMSSPLFLAGLALSFLPQACGYAFLMDPWHVFARPSFPSASAAVAAYVFNPLAGRGGAAAQPLVVH